MMEQRVLPLRGGENFRELGGYQTIDGKSIQWHKIVRSASLADLTTEDQQFLSDYGVRKVLDFRSPSEREKEPDKEIHLAENIFLPVFSVDETKNSVSPDQLLVELMKKMNAEEQMKRINYEFVTEPHSLETYRRFFEILLNNTKDNEVVLFHCTAGKDRTGFGAALFLSALGVDQDTVFEDYLLTNHYLVKKADNAVQEAKKKGAPEALVEQIKDLFTAKPKYLKTAFDTIQANYGSVQNFLIEEMGIGEVDQSDLRKIYLMND